MKREQGATGILIVFDVEQLAVVAFLDLGSRRLVAELLPHKSPISVARFLSDRVLPVYEADRLACIQTKRASEFCGRSDTHDVQSLLEYAGISHQIVDGDTIEQELIELEQELRRMDADQLREWTQQGG